MNKEDKYKYKRVSDPDQRISPYDLGAIGRERNKRLGIDRKRRGLYDC